MAAKTAEMSSDTHESALQNCQAVPPIILFHPHQVVHCRNEKRSAYDYLRLDNRGTAVVNSFSHPFMQ